MIPENKVIDELNKLLVIDRLDVGPVRIEPKRSVTPYTVTRGDHHESFEFIYTFEEPVFVPGDPASENLAAMMGVQIALNYGLFCREIFFHDALDNADRIFIAEMAKNTAREIYVKKFLEPNPFLRGEAAHLPVIQRKSYLQSELIFPNRRNTALDASATKWITFPKRHAILSSGGKDSLLTYGLMREMEEEIHPIYVNESGRHWFTALNAYRHYAEHIPGTARVWTNSDRVFNWMLRQLPFIRKDFAEVRADDYPIRLWTVAVFLFGALPLLKKRGIGRLLIGDEFDTTERRSHEGIPHYHGLFDQSRFFDEAMTRYFKRKQWGISQFSILRPCSESLIQKILTQRYPDLWQHQVSCHAAHKDGDRVYPCGKCEKCRRIVSMLTALNEDPTVCGYTPEQVEPCLKSFAARGIHQESVGAEHIAHLLHSAGKLEVNEHTIRPKEHPEFMKLRFEHERSPFAAIPDDLRIPLYKILLEHADGAVKRSGQKWIEMNPLTDPEAMAPYRAEMIDEDLQRDSAAAV